MLLCIFFREVRGQKSSLIFPVKCNMDLKMKKMLFFFRRLPPPPKQKSGIDTQNIPKHLIRHGICSRRSQPFSFRLAIIIIWMRNLFVQFSGGGSWANCEMPWFQAKLPDSETGLKLNFNREKNMFHALKIHGFRSEKKKH